MSSPNPGVLFWLSRLAAWGTLPVFILGIACFIWFESRAGITAGTEETVLVLGFGAFAAVGSILVARRPHNPVSWIMAGIGLCVGVFPALEAYAAYVMTAQGAPDALAVFGAWANNMYWFPLIGISLIYLPLLFPDGRLISPGWRIVAILAAISTLGIVILSAFPETLHGQNIDYQIRNPIGIPGFASAEEHPLGGLFWFGFISSLVAAVFSVAVRFRRSTGVERQQLKWFLFSAALAPLMIAADFAAPQIGDALFGFVVIGLPVSIGAAILRYKLWDIDFIIRRTLQYTVLTGLLAAIYLAGVVVLQGFIGLFATSDDSPLVTVMTTLGVAALFNPLRIRIQESIDRRFYRKKVDAERALDRFNGVARSEVDLERLSSALVDVILETMPPERISLWLAQSEKGLRTRSMWSAYGDSNRSSS